jgi:hypothetical protein
MPQMTDEHDITIQGITSGEVCNSPRYKLNGARSPMNGIPMNGKLNRSIDQ